MSFHSPREGSKESSTLLKRQAQWTSTNPDFPNSQPVKSDPNDKNSQHVLTAKTLGVQKNLKNLSRTNGYRVGDVIEYTLNFRIE